MTKQMTQQDTGVPMSDAAAAMWLAHPVGPPPDICEADEAVFLVLARSFVLRALGAQVAVRAFPSLFRKKREGMSC